MARPRKTLPEGALTIIRELASNGVKETLLAKALGMSFETWKRIRTDDPEAKAAWQEAKAIEHDRLASELLRQAYGSPAEYDEGGNVIRDEVKPDKTCLLFALKSRHGYRDFGPDEAGAADAGSRVNIVLNLPAALSREDYGKLIELRPNEPVQERAA